MLFSWNTGNRKPATCFEYFQPNFTATSDIKSDLKPPFFSLFVHKYYSCFFQFIDIFFEDVTYTFRILRSILNMKKAANKASKDLTILAVCSCGIKSKFSSVINKTLEDFWEGCFGYNVTLAC